MQVRSLDTTQVDHTGENRITRVIDRFIAVITIAWGLLLLNPGTDAFHAVPGPYDLMARIAPEEVWGATALGLSICRLVAVTFNITWARIILCLIGMLAWGTLALSLYLGSLSYVGLLWPVAMLYANGWILFKLISRARQRRREYNEHANSSDGSTDGPADNGLS